MNWVLDRTNFLGAMIRKLNERERKRERERERVKTQSHNRR